MSLSAGDRLGHYEVIQLLGQGGMGEVYRARDTMLKRDVAVKVLPASLLSDPERITRLQREAEVLASLDHPNIGHIFGMVDSADSRCLVLALIEGPTLADRIAAGPIPVEEAVSLGRQIAEALEYAHDHGIIHRDLKPANIKITPEGVVKVLDFGLAKVLEDAPASSSVQNSPTLTMGHTRAGIILGTASYMSPEQAVGRPVDRRSDIFSFGAVLYEMLTGSPAFPGPTVPDILEAVVKTDPDWSALPNSAPAYLHALLKRCLIKDRRVRLQAAGEARILLSNRFEVTEAPTSPLVKPASKLPWLAAAVLALIAAAVSLVHFRETPPAANLMRFNIPVPESSSISQVKLSPDGRHIAFVARSDRPHIWVRSLDSVEPRRLNGTDGGFSIFWSPDSRYIGFATNTKLMKVEPSGGLPEEIGDIPHGLRGAAWAPDGSIVIATSAESQIVRIPANGGAPTPLTELSTKYGYANPSMLPDGRHFVYAFGSPSQNGIYLGSLDAKPQQQPVKPLVSVPFPNATAFAPSPDAQLGYVLYSGGEALMALPLNLSRLEPAGSPIAVVEGNIQGVAYSASSTGTLVFRAGNILNTDSHLFWFDRQGKQVGELGRPAPYGNMRLSLDGKLLVTDHRGVSTDGYGTDHSWVADVARGVFSRVNPGDANDYAPVISPNGRVAFTYNGGERPAGLYIRNASGAGDMELVLQSATIKHPNDWSWDGRYLIYDDHTLTEKQDLFIIPMWGKPGDQKPVPFLATPADETDAAFSPDSKWIAYSSDESGRREVYVQGFVPDRVPAAGMGKWQISSNGGAKPRWRHDGAELYYRDNAGKLMAVKVKSTATTFEPSTAVPLFDTHTVGFSPYDVSPDGRFLINTAIEGPSANAGTITVVLNWTLGLKK